MPPQDASPTVPRVLIVLGGVILLGLLHAGAGAAGTAAAPGTIPAADVAQGVLHTLDYVAVDYPGAVENGQVRDRAEYEEQVEFVARARTLLEQLPVRPERSELIGLADRLVGLVRERRPGVEVAALANQLGSAIVKAYDVEVAPRRAPDLRLGAGLYASRCAACHGADGRGDGPAGQALDPRPANLRDQERMARRSVYGLYSTITLGVEGTGMASFRSLDGEQRWALAFHVATLGQPDDAVRRGAEIWRAGASRPAVPDLATLATSTTREMQTRHGADAAALLAYLRTRPDLLAASRDTALATTRRLLRQSLEAYRQGRGREAQSLAVSSYLEGFEPLEASLDAIDRGLRTSVETEMNRYRALLRDGAPLPRVEAQAATVEERLARAQALLAAGGLPASATFLSAFLILLREGLEALLVVAATCALLVKADRRDALPYVHAGWIAALGLGAITWVVAAYVVSISGATREVTEGVTALVAASVLLGVGFWMHGKSYARHWQSYITRRLRGALGGRTMSALAFVSFLAVYREAFETVLFYEALAVQAGPGASVPLYGGLLAAAVALLGLGWLIVRGSFRLPLGVFFGATSALLALLAVVFAGKGIAALQEAGWLPIHQVDVPSLPLLGVYPNLQSLLLQAALIVAIVGGFAYTRRTATRPS